MSLGSYEILMVVCVTGFLVALALLLAGGLTWLYRRTLASVRDGTKPATRG